MKFFLAYQPLKLILPHFIIIYDFEIYLRPYSAFFLSNPITVLKKIFFAIKYKQEGYEWNLNILQLEILF